MNIFRTTAVKPFLPFADPVRRDAILEFGNVVENIIYWRSCSAEAQSRLAESGHKPSTGPTRMFRKLGLADPGCSELPPKPRAAARPRYDPIVKNILSRPVP